MPSRQLLRLAFVTCLLGLASCDDAPARPLRETADVVHPKDATLRMNQLQMLATHNSYHIRLEPTGIVDWQYDHAPLGVQLRDQGVRGLEIDVHYQDDLGTYAVMHLGYIDEGTTCATLEDCLWEVRNFSDENPGHHPIIVQIEMKYPGPANVTEAHLVELDREIRAVFPEELMVTPAFVQGTSPTLREAVLAGWPTLGAVRGRTMFMFDCARELCLQYAGTDGALTGRVIFPDSEPADPFAAVMVYNGVDAGAVALVEQGFIVRSFADGIADVLDGTDQLDEALAAGSQLISTDVPAPRTDTAYVADIPLGTPSRCNPRTAPLDCVSTDVEDPALLQGR